jgi:25S rRNA (uracil2843-N3)-methyltransferase
MAPKGSVRQGNRAGHDSVMEHASSASRPAPKKTAPTKKRAPKNAAPKRPANAFSPLLAELAASKEILSLFQNTFHVLFSRPDLHQLLQIVKGHLYNRDYAAAFGAPENLDAYVVRWSPSRALAYRSVFLSLCEELTEVFDVATTPGQKTEVVCMGGGAGAELVGTAAAVKTLLKKPKAKAAEGEEEEEAEEPRVGKLHVTALDMASWDSSFSQLAEEIAASYMPEGRKDVFSADFIQTNVISRDAGLENLVPRSTKLITLLFTTNELYTQSKAATTKMLLSLAGLVEKGCLLLVLESAGSYSTVELGDHKFPMGMLLEHTLLGPGGKGGDWERVFAEDARWYRLPQVENAHTTGLRYPLQLENMRYFVRVFRRL